MTNDRKETLTELWLRRIKNNPLVAIVIVVALVIASISAFTESVGNI